MAGRKEVDIIIKARDEASQVFEKLSRRTLPDLAKSVAQFAAGFVSVQALTSTIKESINAALESEKATAQLSAALMAQGRSIQYELPYLVKHAEALSQVALADDEAIQGAQQLLISLGGLSGEGLDRATQAALDLSAGLGIDLRDAAEKLAKAANGNVKEFSRLGVEFDKNATDAEKLNKVLEFVQSRFGGAAAAQIHTTAGAFHELNEAFKELLETAGKLATQSGDGGIIGGMTATLRALNEEASNPRAMGFWNSLVQIMGRPGLGLAAVIGDAAKASAEMKQLSENMALDRLENPMIGFKDATAAATKEVEKLREAVLTLDKSFVKALPQQGGASPFDSSLPGSDQGKLRESIDAQGLANWIALLDTAPDALDAIKGQFLQIGDTIDNAHEKTISWGEYMQTTFQDALTTTAMQFGDTLIDAAFGADVAWGQAIKNLLAGLAKAIVQAAILRAITTAFGFSGGGVVSGGWGSAVTSGFARGGVVPAYAANGMFVPRGTDTVPAMLTPGEIVLPRAVSQAILGGRASVVPAGGEGTSIVNVHLGGEKLASLLIRNSRAVVEVLDYIDARAA